MPMSLPSHDTPADAIAALSPADDALGHQSAQRFARPVVQDTAHAVFTERYWYMATPTPAGDLVFSAGLGYYPHRGVMDGFAGASRGAAQVTVQASRRLDGTVPELAVGPLRISVLRGLGEHRIALAPNDSGTAADLTFRAAFAPNDEGVDRVVRRGQTVAEVSRFVQFGTYTGWIEMDGRRFEYGDDAPLWGCRDRSWGLRIEPRTDESSPPLTQFSPLFFVWACPQFDDHGIHFFFKETAPGVPRFLAGTETYAPGSGRAPRAIVRIDHELDWLPDAHGQRLARGAFTLHFADGEVRMLRFRALPGRFYLKGGLYGGLRGWFQGDDRGPLHVGHARWNFEDERDRRELRTLADQIVEFDDGRARGWGTLQAGLARGYPKYPEVQHLPFM